MVDMQPIKRYRYKLENNHSIFYSVFLEADNIMSGSWTCMDMHPRNRNIDLIENNFTSKFLIQ